MYTVIGHPRSRTMRVIWALEELKQPYEIIPAAPHSEDAYKHSPTGKVPALVVDGKSLLDSVAIVTFLADRHGGLTHKAGTIERAEQDSFTQFVVDEIDAALWLKSKHTFVLPEAQRVEAAKQTAKWEFDRAMGWLEERLGDREFVTGEAFTIPDLLLSHCAGWALAAKFDLPKGSLGDYLKRLRKRPAFARAMERSAAVM